MALLPARRRTPKACNADGCHAQMDFISQILWQMFSHAELTAHDVGEVEVFQLLEIET